MAFDRKKYKLLLLPLSLLYDFIVRVRNKMFDLNILKSVSFDIPVISVGNISVGGTGKTPHAEYIIKNLYQKYNIALLSRGYGRKTKGFILADENTGVEQIGDEPTQIYKKFKQIVVAVSEDRVKGIKQLLAKFQLNAIILDDAYQHRYVKPGMNILLVSYNNLISKDSMLPAGDLREPVKGVKRAHIVFVTKVPENISPIERKIVEKELNLYPYQSLYFTTIKYSKPISLFNNDESVDLSGKDILLVTAIANTDSIKNYLEKYSKSLTELKYKDHHFWTEKDFMQIKRSFEQINSDNKIIITTEKDAVRFVDNKNITILQKLPVFYLPIEVKFIALHDEQKFLKQLFDYVEKNRRSHKLY